MRWLGLFSVMSRVELVMHRFIWKRKSVHVWDCERWDMRFLTQQWYTHTEHWSCLSVRLCLSASADLISVWHTHTPSGEPTAHTHTHTYEWDSCLTALESVALSVFNWRKVSSSAALRSVWVCLVTSDKNTFHRSWEMSLLAVGFFQLLRDLMTCRFFCRDKNYLPQDS